MQFLVLITTIIAVSKSNSATGERKYKAKWSDLDSRPLPQWYDEAKVGIFVHWGIYSVPGIASEWFWFKWITLKSTFISDYMKENYLPGFSYQEFAPMFKAQLFEPDKWAELFVKSGAKYVVLTSKHHDGFTLFPSKYSPNWNSVDIGPKRDLVHDLSQAVLKQGMKFGLYYSLLEWYHPLYQIDKIHVKKRSQLYIDQKMWPELLQLVNSYKPSVIWSDGDWAAYDTYWRSQDFLAWLYNESPVKNDVVVNDRWSAGGRGKHGGFFNYEDKFNNNTLMSRKWENAFPLDVHSWGYRLNTEISDIVTVPYLIAQLVITVSCGGNVLINVGPTKEGRIPPIYQERLLSLGNWLAINGEAIYKSSPWLHQNDIYNPKVWYTCTKATYNAAKPYAIPSTDDIVTAVYAITLEWPKGNILELGSVSSYLFDGNCQVELMGYKGKPLKWSIAKGMTHIRFPDKSTVKSENAWAVKITSV